MSLYKTAHKQLLASKLKDLISSSPVLLVYQCLGNVRSAQIEDALHSELQGKAPGCDAVPRGFKLKNSLLARAKGSQLSRFLQANNLLLGWHFPGSASVQPGATAAQPAPPCARSSPQDHKYKLQDPVSSLLGDLSQPPPTTKLPQATLSAVLNASLAVSKKHPIAPLAAFYAGEHVRVAHLKDWMQLDEGTVYSALLAQLESVPEGLCALGEAHVGDLLACLDNLQPTDLLQCLDAQASATPEPSQPR